MSKWTTEFPKTEIIGDITDKTVKFAKEFGSYLGVDLDGQKDTKLTTNQLRKFFGEVKRQQMNGYNETDFVLLKPKLAYAVGRNKKANAKIKDFYEVISVAIDEVQKGMDVKSKTERFKRFIKIFEAIVAYHKAAEEKISIN
jgi:CRISPR type III-A-associated protein Csm2